jgi:hypothetical protein
MTDIIDSTEHNVSTTEPVGGRRRLLRLAGAAAAGAAAAAMGTTGSAGAANGDPILIGQLNTGTAPTSLLGSSFGSVLSAPASFAMAGANTSASASSVGMQGVSAAGAGVQGLRGGPGAPIAEGTGVDGQGATVGVRGVAGTSSPISPVAGTGVQGVGSFAGVEAVSQAGYGLSAISNTSTGVRAESSNGTGVHGVSSSFVGVDASSGSYIDLRCTGTGRLWLADHTSEGAPTSGTYFEGEVIRDVAGNFFVCVIGGSPGVWRKIGGPTTSGTLHNVTPFRAYDSRRAGYPVNGAMAMGTNRVVSIADAHDLATGNVTVANVVPAGATAVNYNLTVVAPTNTTGFASLMPGDASTFTVASINWSVVGQTIANASTVPLDGGRQVKVFVGSGLAGSAHVIIDIVGYYM